MIIAPILLSFIYEKNQKWTFYITSCIFALALCVMVYIRTWKHAVNIGKIPLCQCVDKERVENEKVKEIELVEVVSGEKEREENKQVEE